LDVRTTAEENISGLTDLAMAVRAAVEDKDPSRLGALFAPAALICVSGRFLGKDEALRRLAAFFRTVEQLAMELTRLEEHEVTVDGLFGSFAVEFHWTDTTTWEERNAIGTLSLTARRGATMKTEAVTRAAEWQLTGFAYTPRTSEPADQGLTRGVGPSGWATNLIDAAYGPLSVWR
jgi:hypothetical protein